MELTDDVKKKVREHLKEVNEHFAEAIDLAKKGSYIAMARALVEAKDAKHLALSCIPDVPFAEGFLISFEAVYDLFYDIDSLVDDTLLEMAVAEQWRNPEQDTGRLREVIDELLVNVYLKSKKAASPALDGIDELIHLLLEVLDLFKLGFQKGHDYTSDWEGYGTQLQELKAKILKAAGGEIKLEEIYAKFEYLDFQIASFLRFLKLVLDGKYDFGLSDPKDDFKRQIESMEYHKTNRLEPLF